MAVFGRGRCLMALSIAQRLMRNVIFKPKSRCWVWIGSINAQGYGLITLMNPKHTRVAHRVSYELFNGPIPAGLNVLHRCDRPPCINPDHLWAGTQSQNLLDCSKKGRHDGRNRLGSRHPLSKLTELQVLSIRALPGSDREVASLFGVSTGAINLIRRRKRWSHI